MDTIVDLRQDQQDHELLTETAVSGRIRSETILREGPLSSYLGEKETPLYILRNKKSGVELRESSSETTIEPDDGYQTLALVTDLRVLFVIGRADGDKTGEVQLADIVEAKSQDNGLRSTALVLETISDRAWSFPCRGDTEAVASVLDDLAQTWAGAERRAEEVEAKLDAAEALVEEGDHEGAAEEISGIKPTLKTILKELRDVGPAAEAHARDRADSLAKRLLDLQGPIRAQRAATAHAEAQSAWDDGEYEAAAAAYERALDRYERALERESGPPTAHLNARLEAALTERELLGVCPLVDADTARRRAHEVDEPEAAAAEWEDVLGMYQQVLELSWPGEGSFVATPQRLREQAASAAEDAIEDYYEAGRRRLGSADEFSVNGRDQRATVLYERAREQFQQAKRLAAEAHPDRVDEIETAVQTVEDRLDGDAPTSHLPAEELPISDVDIEQEGPDDTQEEEPAQEQEYDESSVIGRIQSQKTADTGTDGTDTHQPDQSTADALTNTAIRGKLRDLDEETFTEFVADLWEAQGWSTTVFSTTNQVVYDIVAMRDEPETRRLLLWTAHRADDEQIGPRTIERCATARDSSQGADSATLVTNALLRTAATQRADGLDVTVIDGGDLVELVRFEGFLDRLDQATVEQ